MDDFEVVDGDVEIAIGVDGSILPEANDLIALIDADTLAFTACLNAQQRVELLPREFYTESEWEEIMHDPTYNEELGEYYTIDINVALQNAEDKLQKIYELTGCRECELHFTKGRKNFRYRLVPNYKANRKDMKAPAGLADLKELLLANYNGDIHEEWEADDHVIFLYKKYPGKYQLTAVDKDVYNSVPGKHFNYFECNYIHHISGKPVVRNMEFIETSENRARMWPYYQVLLGDSTDNIKGVKGIGEKTIPKFINGSMTEYEMWQGVIKACESKNHPIQDTIFDMNLVNMHQLHEVDGELKIIAWTPPEEEYDE